MKSNTKGVLIPLGSKEALEMYLQNGVYSQRMGPKYELPTDGRTTHYKILADYCALREGDHVFFFYKRTIYYGGTVIGSDKYGSFYINGQTSPIGVKNNAPLAWDESKLSQYEEVSDREHSEGVYKIKSDDDKAKANPFLMLFDTHKELFGRKISSDELYDKLSLRYITTMPSSGMRNVGFTTISPTEVEILLKCLKNSSDNISVNPQSDIKLTKSPLLFKPESVLESLTDEFPESYLEASILGNPSILPQNITPKPNTCLCRQVPVCSNKPTKLDRTDISYYNNKSSTSHIPDTILELKVNRAGASEGRQIRKYLEWLNKTSTEGQTNTTIYVLAPSFSNKQGTDSFLNHFTEKQRKNVSLITY